MSLSDMNDQEIMQEIAAQTNRMRQKLGPAEAEALNAPLAHRVATVACPRCGQPQQFASPTVGELLALVALHLKECDPANLP